MQTMLFFSYSNEDSAIAAIYLELLVCSELVRREEVFCFERPGAQGTAGRAIVDELASAMQAKSAIALVSQRYLRSNYCVGEFGFLRCRSMQEDLTLLPVAVPPVTSENAGPFFRDIGLFQGEPTADSLNRILDGVARALNRRVNLSVWESCRTRAMNSLQANLREAASVEEADVELCDLPPATLGRILAVRRERLTKRERKWFYTRFQALEPQYHVPEAPVTSPQVQCSLEERRPLDDSVLVDLCEAYDVPLPDLARPFTDASKEALVAVSRAIADQVFAAAQVGELAGGVPSARRRAWQRTYDYLSCESDFIARRGALAETDVILVPGARRGHVFRADEAAAVSRIAPNLSLVVFSGGHPIFDDEQDLPFSEADALAERYLIQFPTIPSSVKLRVDNRARTTAESVAHMKIHLQRVVRERGRPVVLTLVTSPYHMRRFRFLVSASLDTMGNLVEQVQGSLSTASFDWGLISNPRSPDQLRLARYGIGVYTLELAKLYGGRATGEF